MLKRLVFFCSVFLLVNAAAGQTPDSTAGKVSTARFFRHIYENDFFDATDMYYTQGLDYEFFLPVFHKSPINFILPSFRKGVDYSSIALHQDCFTPSSIRRDTVFTGDRPFAATAYLRETRISNDDVHKQRLTSSVDVGVMGPCAKCEEEQKAIHKALVNIQPLGWQFQIRQDLILNYNLVYEKALLSEKYAEIILHGNASAGTLYDNLGGGAMLRAGKMLSWFRAVGPGEDAASSRFQIYGFVMGNAKVVAYNASMEGGLFDRNNIYTLPPSAIERGVIMLQYGIVLSWKHLNIEFSNVDISPEFKNGMDHAWGHCVIFFSF